jgi:hypothetical protein
MELRAFRRDTEIRLYACFNGAIFGDETTIEPSVLTEKDLGFEC